MNDVVIVGILECVGSLLNNGDQFLWRERSGVVVLLYPLQERAFGAIRHHQESETRSLHSFLTIVEKRQDWGVIEVSNGPRLAQEETDALRSRCALSRRGGIDAKHFDSYLPANSGIFGKVDLAHTPAANQTQQVIAANLRSFK